VSSRRLQLASARFPKQTGLQVVHVEKGSAARQDDLQQSLDVRSLILSGRGEARM